MKDIKLTQVVNCAGCAGKLPPKFLSDAVHGIDWYSNQNVIQAMENNEDAGVFKINETESLIQTTDFFTPVVDDPFTYGQIAAANALSDIYAMGAKPLSALNLVCYSEDLGPEILKEILRGGNDKAKEADCPILGGHSVKAPELKYGMAITGIAQTNKIKYNSGAKVGDILILTKALGTGILNTAIKRSQLSPSTMKTLIESMAGLNKKAAEIMIKYDTNASTDVTGFSLVGHGMEMAKSSNTDLLIDTSTLPVLPDVLQAIKDGFVTGGDKNNRIYTDGHYQVSDNVSSQMQNICFDPQTSGGLLLSVSKKDAQNLLKELQDVCQFVKIIGEVTESKNNQNLVHLV
ncbi:MAG: selenide, water dikinase SelD [Candidatus Cloacimonadota bacterium]|nr:MAG: selenide, water dikinase SelD [Candidatus Cloacimonadota bacterium]